MNTTIEQKINKKNIRNTYFKYLIPTVIGMVTHCFYCLADVFFVGIGVGSNGLAALNVALPVFTIYSTFSIMIGVGAATTISIFTGQGNKEDSDKVFTQSVILVLLIGLLFSIFGTIFIKEISYLFGATDLIINDVIYYLFPINIISFVFLLSSSLTVIIRSDGNPKLVMSACTIGNLVNVILDYVFVITLDMGLFGAGLATIIGPCITIIILCFHFIKKYNNINFTKNFYSVPLLIRLIKNGIGSGVLELSSGFVILIFNIMLINLSGENAVAIFSIISNIGYVCKGIFNGIAQAAQPLISTSYGTNDYKRMTTVNYYASLTALIFSLGVYLLILLFPENIISFFISNNSEIISMGKNAIIIYFLSFPFTGLNTVLMYYFQSIEKVSATTAISLLRGIVIVYISLLILPKFLGINGIWISLFVSEITTFMIFYPLKLNFDKKLLLKK